MAKAPKPAVPKERISPPKRKLLSRRFAKASGGANQDSAIEPFIEVLGDRSTKKQAISKKK
jgi:hypothetical protein